MVDEVINFWDLWSKPWTLDQARKRYVEGDAVTPYEVAKQSGIPYIRLRQHTQAFNWDMQRRAYKADVSTKQAINKDLDRALVKRPGTTQGLLEQETDHDKKKIIQEHLEAAQLTRALSTELLNEAYAAMHDDGGTVHRDAKRYSPNNLAHVVKMLKTAVDMERQALGLEYEDLNTAMQKLITAGYTIISSPEAALINLMDQHNRNKIANDGEVDYDQPIEAVVEEIYQDDNL
jgi:hypothetical protein